MAAPSLETADSNVHFTTHSFHINIGTGDCSIHLLVDEKKDPPEIWRACLIDGGEGQSAVKKIRDVIDFINSVPGHCAGGKPNYSFKTGQLFGESASDTTLKPSLRFDTVMITHWDKDHYDGVWYLLEESVKEDLDTNIFHPQPPPAKAPAAEKSTQCIGGYQCKYFKYSSPNSAATTKQVFADRLEWQSTAQNPSGKIKDTNGKTLNESLKHSIDATNLQTVLYVPYIAGGAREPVAKGPGKASKNKTPATTGKKTAKSSPKPAVNDDRDSCSIGGRSLCHTGQGRPALSRPCLFSNDYSPYVNKASNTAGFMVEWPNKPSSPTTSYQYWFYNQCKLRAWYEDYLGIELFGNLPLNASLKWSDIQSPNGLVQSYGLLKKHGPRMFLVAGDQMILGNVGMATALTTSKGGKAPKANFVIPPHVSHQLVAGRHVPVSRIVNSGLKNQGQAKADTKTKRWDKVREGSAPKNSASIVIITISSTVDLLPTSMPSNPCFRMWHYTGGDALWDVEASLANWLLGSSSPSDAWVRAVKAASMKLSHHGGVTSTPSNLLEALKPKVLLCPSKTAHGHPRPEIIFYIHAINDDEATTGNKIEFLLYNKPSWWFPSDREVVINGPSGKKKSEVIRVPREGSDEWKKLTTTEQASYKQNKVKLASRLPQDMARLTERIEAVRLVDDKFSEPDAADYFAVDPLYQPKAKTTTTTAPDADFVKAMAKYYVKTASTNPVGDFANMPNPVPTFWKYKSSAVAIDPKTITTKFDAKKLTSIISKATQRAEICELWFLVFATWQAQICPFPLGRSDMLSDGDPVSFFRSVTSTASTTDGDQIRIAYTVHGNQGSVKWTSPDYIKNDTNSTLGDSWTEGLVTRTVPGDPSIVNPPVSKKRTADLISPDPFDAPALDFKDRRVDVSPIATNWLDAVNQTCIDRISDDITIEIDEDWEASYTTIPSDDMSETESETDSMDDGDGMNVTNTMANHPLPAGGSQLSTHPQTLQPHIATSRANLPIRAEVMAAADPSPGLSSTTFWLAGTSPTSNTTTTGETILVIQDGKFKTFVSRLGDGCLELASDFSTVGAADVAQSDTWFGSVSANKDNNKLGISAIHLTGSKGANSNTVAVTKISVDVSVGNLSSGKSVLNFTTDPAPNGPDSNFAGDFQLMTLWLDPSTSSMTLGDLLTSSNRFVNYALRNLPGLEDLNDIKLKLVDSSSTGCPCSSLTFRSDSVSTTWLRLVFITETLTDATSKITSALNKAFPFLAAGIQDISKAFQINSFFFIILRKMANTNSTPTIVDEVSVEVDLVLDPNGIKMHVTAYIEFNGDLANVILKPNGAIPADSYTTALSRIANFGNVSSSSGPVAAGSDFKPDNILGDIAESNASPVSFDLVQLRVAAKPTLSPKAILQRIEAKFAVKVYDAIFLGSMSWCQGNVLDFAAALWTGPTDQGQDSSSKLVPFVNDYDDAFTNSDILTAAAGSATDTPYTNDLQLTGLIGTDFNSHSIAIPDSLGLNINVDSLAIAARKSGSGDTAETTVMFHGQISSGSSSASAPKITLGSLAIDFKYHKLAKSNTTKYLSLQSKVYLIPRSISAATPVASLDVSIKYDQTSSNNNSIWNVRGSVSNLYFSTLFDLFDADSQSAVMDFMEEIYVSSLWVEWNHMSNPPSTNLSAGGTIVVGLFALDFSYTYGKSPDPAFGIAHSNWMFKASLGSSVSSSTDSPTLGDLIASLPGGDEIGDEINSLPFVSSITIPPAKVTDGADPPIQFCITKAPGSETIMWLMLAITTEIGTLSFTYVQIQDKRDGTTNSDGSLKDPPKGYKRVVRVMLDRLPSLPKIPVVGDIKQPFDSIDYVFVSDTTPQTDSNTKLGLSTEELDLINSTMNLADQIPYRKTVSNLQNSSPGQSSNAAASAASAPVLAAGHHFILSSDGKVILDHLFNSSAVPQTKPSANTSGSSDNKPNPKPDTKPATEAVPATTDSGATMGSLNKQASSTTPLSISNIGLRCKDGYLYILLDATVSLGPIQLSLVGLGVGVPLADLKNGLSGLSKIDVSTLHLIISGMSVEFNRPPVMLSGTFIEFNDGTNEGYKGGITVSILPYTLLAVGEYEHNMTTDMRSVFVFASLNGPLLTLEFAEITDVSLGFGYNYWLRSPDFDEIFEFPLVQAAASPPTQMVTPMQTLDGFSKFNAPSAGSMWFALGAKIDAFEILSVDAVIILQFSPSDFVATLIGVTEVTMPPDAPRQESFVFVQLGIIATIDPGKGTLMIGGQLSPNSFLLYPDCHLTGAFVLRYWFPPSGHAGDWVFSIGGYHPAYHAPDYYGPAPERVGISWDLSDCLSIRGGAFFAITPQLCMGGGNLKAVFNAGPIFAQFEAWASFIMNFKPFFFKGEIGVSITVGFDLDLWIIHISFHGEISGTLHLSGPEFGGTVYVDLKIHTFSIDFGSQDNTPNPLSWDEFLNVVMQQRGAGVMDGGDSPAILVVAIEEGSASEKIASSKRKTGDSWWVRAGTFRFRVESKVPLRIENDNTNSKTLVIEGIQAPTTDTTGSNTNVLVDWHLDQTLEQSTALDSLKNTQMYARPMGPSRGSVELLSELTITIQYKHPVNKESKPFRVVPITRKMPNALWSQYKGHEDPISSGDNNINTLLSPSSNAPTTEYLVGFHVDTPVPALPEMAEKIPAMNIMTLMSEGVFHGPTPGTSSGQNSISMQKFRPLRPLLSPPLPDQNGNEPDDRPILPVTAPTQTGFLPKTRTSDQWTQVISAWNNAPDASQLSSTHQQDLCDAWVSLCGWDVPTSGKDYPRLMPTKPSMILTPPKDTKELDNFANYYLSAPLLTDYA